MKKAIIFDSGTLISLEMAGLLNVLEKLKKSFDGEFLITKDVKYEVIDRSIKTKRFELGALRVKSLLEKGILSTPENVGIKEKEIKKESEKIVEIANKTFYSSKKNIEIIHIGEASCLALSKILTKKDIKNLIAVDERTTRVLGEKPENLKKVFEKKLHTSIKMRKNNFKHFRGFKFIRSPEIVYIAHKKGLIDLKGKDVLDALLYAVKFKGAAISGDEIKKIKSIAKS